MRTIFILLITFFSITSFANEVNAEVCIELNDNGICLQYGKKLPQSTRPGTYAICSLYEEPSRGTANLFLKTYIDYDLDSTGTVLLDVPVRKAYARMHKLKALGVCL